MQDSLTIDDIHYHLTSDGSLCSRRDDGLTLIVDYHEATSLLTRCGGEKALQWIKLLTPPNSEQARAANRTRNLGTWKRPANRDPNNDNHKHYCIIDMTGKVIWRGTSAICCADNWLPGTFWGGGDTKQLALQQATQYVAVLAAKEATA